MVLEDNKIIEKFVYIKDDIEFDFLGIASNDKGKVIKYRKCLVKDKLKKGDKIILTKTDKGFIQHPIKFEKDCEYSFKYLENYNDVYIKCEDYTGNIYLVRKNYSLLKTLKKGEKINCVFETYYDGKPRFKLPFYPLQINDILNNSSKEKFLNNYLGNGYDLFIQYKDQLNDGNNLWILSLTNYLDKNITGLLSRGLTDEAIKCIEIYESMFKFIKSAKNSGLGKYSNIKNHVDNNSQKFERLLSLKAFLKNNNIDDFFEIQKLINIQHEFITFFNETGYNIIDRSEILEILNNINNSKKIDEFKILIDGFRYKLTNHYLSIISEYSKLLFLNKNQNDKWLDNNLDEIDLRIIDFIYKYDKESMFFSQLYLVTNALVKREIETSLKTIEKLNDIIEYNFDGNKAIEKGFNLSVIVEIKEGMYYSKVNDNVLYIYSKDFEIIESAIKRGKSIICKTASSFKNYKFISVDGNHAKKFNELEFDCIPVVIKLEKFELGLLNKLIYYTYIILDSIRFDVEDRKEMLHFLSSISGYLKFPKSFAYKILDNADFKLRSIKKYGEKFNFETFEHVLEGVNEKTLEKFPQLEILLNQLHLMKYINSNKDKDIIDIIKDPQTLNKDLYRKILVYNLIGDTDIGINKVEILNNILTSFSGLEKEYQENIFNKQPQQKNLISKSSNQDNNVIQQIYDGNYKESMNLEFKETLICPVLNKNQHFQIQKINNNQGLDPERKNHQINEIISSIKYDSLSKRIITHHTFKNICGMLNTSGGKIIIGVRDLHPELRKDNDFEYPGLFQDYNLLNGGWDELLLYFDDYFKNYVVDHNTFLPFVKPELQEFNNRKFMIINVDIPYNIDKICVLKDTSDSNKEKAFEKGFASCTPMSPTSIQKFKRIVKHNEKPQNLYMVKNDRGQYKIGIARNFKTRLSGLRTADPSIELFYKKTFKTKQIALDLENYLINRFSSFKIERDWFQLNEFQLEDCKNKIDNQFNIHGFNLPNEIDFS